MQIDITEKNLRFRSEPQGFVAVALSEFYMDMELVKKWKLKVL